MKEKHLLVITGPTAVGKTALTIQLATEYQLEIVSCDSRQFYKEMNIGTAKPSVNELQLAPHHFINTLSISEDYSAGDFERDGLALLDKLFEKSDTVILTGGSGLYIKALCEGFDEFPDVPSVIFEKINQYPLEKLQAELSLKDPTYFQKVDIENKQRLVRALSVFESSGKPFSHFLGKRSRARNFTPTYVILNRNREELYERINLRVDQMIEQGLEAEAKELFPFRSYNSLQTVGYQEFFDYFDGKIERDEAIELIKRNSRRYAKRQLTWFRKIPDAIWLHPEDKIDLKTLIFNP
ncbi:tRNA (adenosine(37)-N6)-dimethylallyltransferase MiaA [Portibacter lacus]|uniref:tRNA (adenosine(37)-N6)-dimethylallyltransferase MiaA n=1 Tax=Portibacter lacus TaxID=1099794 RepID=UPI001F00F8B7|nr:tRNA (adenosine(37)-N6)-dimethylallyltransferase MiaA [Portibacter lacus]